MNQNIRYYAARSPRITVVLGLVLFVGSQAWADALGRLRIIVKDAETSKPISGAHIRILDPTKAVPEFRLDTDAKGSATTDPIADHNWTVTVSAADYIESSKDIKVEAEKITDISFLLGLAHETVITIKATKKQVTKDNTSQGNTISQDVITRRTNPGNAQSISSVLQTVPGFVADSNGQIHPEGEHSSTSYFLNNFQLPSGFQGHLGSYIAPNTIKSVDILTGGYAPQYGRDTAAIVDAQIRTGSAKPFVEYSLTGGGFDTWEGGAVAGGQFGKAYGKPGLDGRSERAFSYLFDLDYRYTGNLEEPPQPGVQTAHNKGVSTVSFANLDWRMGEHDRLNLILSNNPARSEVANRTGLPSFFATAGQGYGFGGLQGPSSGLLTQQQAGQDDYEKDGNSFGILSYRHDFSSATKARMAFGLVYNGLSVLNNNPAVSIAALPDDNSIEFNPTAVRNARDAQWEGDITSTSKRHTLKAGFTIDRQTGLEYYQLTPASTAALNYLLSGDPTGATPADPTNPLYLLAPVGGISSFVTVSRSGYYNAGYLQDTWKISKRLTANYGARYEVYTSEQGTSQNGGVPIFEHVGLQMVEPRLNFAYDLSRDTTFRTSYNRLMIVPPSAQGAGLNVVAIPEKINQYEASLEKKLAPGQLAKVRYYMKEIRDQLDTGLLAPGTQVGIYVTDNIPKDWVRGFEASYNLFPVKKYGWDAYFSYANATAKPQGNGNPFNDHDQLNTISTGANYTFKHGEQAGMTLNYGSGVFSSIVYGTTRTPHSDYGLRLASAPNFMGLGGQLSLEVQNLFAERNVLNFQSGFSGTRFQQGRRLLLTWSGKF